MPTPSGHTRAITAKRAIGTTIKDASGERIGKVEDLVLDKMSSEILFAVAGFGGVMGVGEKYHPIPWALLDYDPDDESYRVNLTKDEIKAAPCDTIDELTANDGAAFRDKSFAHFGVERRWSS